MIICTYYKITTGIRKFAIQCTKTKLEIRYSKEKMDRVVKVPKAFCELVSVVASFCYQVKIVILRSCCYLHDVISKHAPQIIEIFVNKQINLYFSEGTLT